MRINVAIIEDNPDDRAILESYLSEVLDSHCACTSGSKKVFSPQGLTVPFEESDHLFRSLKLVASCSLLKCSKPPGILLTVQWDKQGGDPMSRQSTRRIVSAEKLSQREKTILQQLSKGHSTKAIADHLTISVNTVRTHLQHIYKKLHVRSRTAAVLEFLN